MVCQKLMLEWATESDYKEFDVLVTDWVRFVDEDGTRDRNEINHENGRARVDQDFDGSFSIEAGCGSMQGAMIKEIFDQFYDAEFRTDWDRARAELGDAVTVNDLERTDAQRRMDALFAVFSQAASTPPGGTGPRTVLNLVMDWDTYQRELCRLEGGHPAARNVDAGFDRFRCSTLDGSPVEPTEATVATLTEHVCRAVIGAESVVIDKGRAQRLFTDSAAVAARVASTHCGWRGCWVPNRHCQIDHLQPYHPRGSDELPGMTDQRNAGLFCGRHNRLKSTGRYHVWRDPKGRWRIERPDGTLLE
ncbi:MAG: hypothetical protein P8N02_17535 [Actinomycetota bacterium]|nr:hypothetical protein [Actinomycetota bacterium]